jgi:hypothetical protein
VADELMAQSPIALTVGKIELTADPTPEVDWGLETLEGWYEGADINAPGTRRANSPGVFFEQGLAGGKMITVNGFVRSTDRTLLTEAMDTISSTLADGSLGTMSVYDEDSGWRWAPVQRTGPPQISLLTRRIIRFQLQFLAPDAYRYGQTSTATVGFAASSGSGMVFPLFNPGGFLSFGALPSSGSVSIQNPGTAPSSPVFTVTGPTPVGGFVIIDSRTGKRITFLGSVPDNTVLTLDASDGSVLLQGVADRLGDTLVEAWPVVPPRSVANFVFEPLGSATPALLTASAVATYH